MRCVACLITVLAIFCGCSSKEDRRKSDDKLLMRVKLEAASKALAEIKSRRDRGLTIYADCKTAKMLFLADLKQHKSKESEQLATDLLKACQKARASELVETQ